MLTNIVPNGVFDEGDWVFLKLQPYQQHSMHSQVIPKLSARYFGPFLILEKVGNLAYQLQLPKNTKIHDVFHISLLKKAYGPPTQAAILPLALLHDH